MFAHWIDDQTCLRLLQQQHASELFALVDAHREHLRAWLPWVDATQCEQDSMDFIVMQVFTFAQQGLMTCGIWHGGALCGVIGHNDIDPEQRVARLGYWLAADHQGRGLMTACVAAFVEHAFDTYELQTVEIRVAPRNRRSRAIPERLGFTEGAVIQAAERLHDRTVDHVCYTLERPDWRPQP